MTQPTRRWNLRNLPTLAFAAIAVTVGACSSGGTTASSTQLLPRLNDEKRSTPAPYSFAFQTVDYPQGGNASRVTGIDERANVIVGLNGTTQSTYSSWVAHTPDPSSTGYREFQSRNYPGAAGTYMAAMSNTFYQAGTVFSPPPSNSNLSCTACGVVYYGKGNGTGYGSGSCSGRPCRWTFIQDPNEGTGSCAVTEVLGLSGSNIVVGYYQIGASSCGSQAFEAYFNASGEDYADFDVPGADPNTAEATGVNELEDVVGTAQFGGVTKGWLYIDSAYCAGLAAPNATGTYPLGINWQDQLVGYYEDTNQQSHGFVLLNPTATAQQQIWETVDEPQANGYTVVNNINTHHSITGWYKDAHDRLNGFVGTCTNCSKTLWQGSERDVAARPASGSSGCVPAKSLRWKRR